MPQAPNTGPLSVSEAVGLAKTALEGITITLVGEVSELSIKPGYKAVYFSVKDEGSTLPCMMWMNRYRQADAELALGSLVQLTGRFTLYAAKGRMNFDVFSVSLAGEGNLRQKVAELARKLKAEGLMEPSRKRPLPHAPSLIGLVTSPRGAAVHDVLRTLRRRYPLATVLIAGVPVEGAQAPHELAQGLRVVEHAGAQVILLVRGGGSFEDLMPFNDEGLARAIAASAVPVVTGIGHEPDTSIADMVADLRASTPTAAAEAVAPDLAELRRHAGSQAMAMGRAMASSLSRWRMRLDNCASRPVFEDPLLLFSSEALALDNAEERLSRALPSLIERDRVHLKLAYTRMQAVGAGILDAPSTRLSLAASRLDDLSPLSVVGRGYALVRDADGALVRSVGQVRKDDTVQVTLADGVMSCTVENIERTTTLRAQDQPV